MVLPGTGSAQQNRVIDLKIKSILTNGIRLGWVWKRIGWRSCESGEYDCYYTLVKQTMSRATNERHTAIGRTICVSLDSYTTNLKDTTFEVTLLPSDFKYKMLYYNPTTIRLMLWWRIFYPIEAHLHGIWRLLVECLAKVVNMIGVGHLWNRRCHVLRAMDSYRNIMIWLDR